MAYETGTATSPNDLLDKLRLFLVANGWTVNAWTAVGAGYRLHVQKGTLYFNFRSAVNEWVFQEYFTGNDYKYYIGLMGSDGYSAGSDWDKQPGAPQRTANSKYIGAAMTCRSDGVTAYYFFLGSSPVDYCHVFVRYVNPGTDGLERWGYMSFGTLEKFGTWTGGAYFCANRHSYYATYYILSPTALTDAYIGDYPPYTPLYNAGSGNGFVRITSGAIDGWTCCGSTDTSIYSYLLAGKFCMSNAYDPTKSWDLRAYVPHYGYNYKSLANQMNGLAIMSPLILFWHYQTGATGNFKPLGRIPMMYFSRITAFTYGNVYQFGSVDFLPFPWYRILLSSNIICGALVRKIV